MGHYPIVFGIVLYAVVAEQVASHPDDELTTSGRWIFALAVALVVFGLIVVARRSGLPLLWERGAAAILVIVAAFAIPVSGWVVVIGFVGAMVVAIVAEDRRRSPVTTA
jgi:low temperature requirement protein LtrA